LNGWDSRRVATAAKPARDGLKPCRADKTSNAW
jgi:hypothetical protein